jgi:hypothetical protein
MRVAGVPQWQSIETAPKDGRTILLGHYNSHGKWRTLRGQWFSAATIAETWEDDECPEGWYETSVECDDDVNAWWTEPTHWKPLDPPPGAAPSPITDAVAPAGMVDVNALHRDIMNLPLKPGWAGNDLALYAEGHRDARHAAAELVCAALAASPAAPATQPEAEKADAVDAKSIWCEIAETAPLCVIKGKKGIFLDEAACVRLGTALEM